MGKQSKRKTKGRGGGNKSQHHRPTGLADDPAAAATAAASGENESPTTKITSKIRHGDPRVRHAALVALSRTLYDCSSLESSAKKKKYGKNNATSSANVEANNPLLLRALSEKILDVDIPCATIAVGCLSNYVSFYCSGSGSSDVDNSSNDVDVASDVMVPILLQRLSSSLGTISLLGTEMESNAQNTTATPNASPAPNTSAKKKGSGNNKKGTSDGGDKTKKEDKVWLSIVEQWSLLSLSLITLAGLIENCPAVLQRVGINAFPQLMGVLPLASASIQYVKSNEKKEKDIEPILDSATNAARALHSLLDDNKTLITSLPKASVAAAGSVAEPCLTSAISELTKTITNVTMPNMARLHASGSILSLRRVLVLDEKSAIGKTGFVGEDYIVTALQSCTNEVVVPLLSSLFDSSFLHDNATSAESASSNPRHLLHQMTSLSNQLSKIKQDETMESQIVNEQNARKESSRDIAKRQKKMKEEKKKLKQESMDVQGMNEDKDEAKKVDGTVASAGAAMVVEEDESTDAAQAAQEEAEKAKQAEDDLQDQLDNVVSSWKDLVGSHKLALELVANLCNSDNGEDEEDSMMGGGGMEDDDEHMWDSDDEAKLISSASAARSGGGDTIISPWQQATHNAMSTKTHDLPMKILGFFRKWTEFVPSAKTAGSEASMDNEKNVEVPALVKQDVDEILATCALCLGNTLACNLPTWNNGLEVFWREVVVILTSAVTNDNNEVMESKSSVTSVMLSMLRSQPQSRTLVDESTLGVLFALLSQQPQQNMATDAATDKTEALTQTHCNVISILGVLCSEPHPASIDTKVCSSLLERLRSAAFSSSDTANDNNPEAMKQTVIITHEILNVIMDMYGGDDCHDDVFEKNKVLDHFRRCLPGFKRCVKKIGLATVRGKEGAEEEEVCIWNETALNASRFIKYKNGG